jgi:hypothetical protein
MKSDPRLLIIDMRPAQSCNKYFDVASILADIHPANPIEEKP